MPERKVEYQAIANRAKPELLLKSPSLHRLIVDSALALTDSMVSLDLVKDSLKESVSVKGSSKEDCLAQWLNAVIQLFTQKKYLPKRIVFNQFTGTEIQATLFGDTYESTRHGHIAPIAPFTADQFEFRSVDDGINNFSVKIVIVHQRTDKP